MTGIAAALFEIRIYCTLQQAINSGTKDLRLIPYPLHVALVYPKARDIFSDTSCCLIKFQYMPLCAFSDSCVPI